MNFFKKPFVAVLLSMAIIVSSTLFSVNIKLGDKCQDITDGFYEGVDYEGYAHKSIAGQIKNICGAADGMATIAANYGLNTDAVIAASKDVKDALTYGSVSYVGYCYNELIAAVKPLEDQLSREQLSDRDAEGLGKYSSTINGAQAVIEKSGYNESVREFLREYKRLPAEALAVFSGVNFPELFE